MALQDCDAPTFEDVDSTLTVPDVAFDAVLVAQTQSGSGYDLAIPGLGATWSAATNPYVQGIEFEYTPTSFVGQTKKSAVQAVSQSVGGSWVTTDGIVSEGVYDCRWRAIGLGGKVGEWSVAVEVTIDTQPGLTGDLAKFLWTIPLNIWRFDPFTVSNGAAKVTDLTNGEQLDGITIPGGAAAIYVERPGVTYGLAETNGNGAAYCFQFLGWVDSGTATLRGRFLDASDNPISDVSDVSFSLTTTPTVFTWEDIFSDDADFTSAKFQLFTSGTGDIPSGRTVTITDLMMEAFDYFEGELPATTPWRPAPGEANLTRYAALLQTLFEASLTATNQTRRTNEAGNGESFVPPGLTRVRREPGTAVSLTFSDLGSAKLCSHATNCDVTVSAKGTEDWYKPGVITLIADPDSTGTVTVVEDTGVKVHPPYGGTLVIPSGGIAQLMWLGSRRYPAGEWLMLGNAEPA